VAARLSAPNDEEERPRLPLRRPRTLLVEDEVKALLRRRDLFLMKDLDVIAVRSKSEALERLQAIGFRVDAVMTDLNLTADSDSIEGIEVAAAVADRSSGTVPIYGYSGKERSLPKNFRGLFRDVVLKTDSSRRVREVFREASEEAFKHFNVSAERAETLLAGVASQPFAVPRGDLTLIRDLTAGSGSAVETFEVPDRVGFLPLTSDNVGVAYGLVTSRRKRSLSYARIIGHEYLYGYGADADEAVEALRDVMLAFANTMYTADGTWAADSDEAVGPSRRLRRLMHALHSRQERLDMS
jgi:CheY-like chemotaxis protein